MQVTAKIIPNGARVRGIPVEPFEGIVCDHGTDKGTGEPLILVARPIFDEKGKVIFDDDIEGDEGPDGAVIVTKVNKIPRLDYRWMRSTDEPGKGVEVIEEVPAKGLPGVKPAAKK